MKLRNKKTGRVVNFRHIVFDEPKDDRENYRYSSLAEFNEEWEDYEPKEPLIKDEKIRKAVRLWAEINDYEKCLVRVYDYDRMGVCIEEGVTSFVSCDTQLGITFFSMGLDIETEKVYTIAELCGEVEK